MNPEETDLQKVKKELIPYGKMMSEASDTILDQEVSKYPIFVAHQQENIDMGIAMTDHREGGWSIHASTLEEFAAKQLISPERVENFRQIFKDPLEYICIFLIREIGATFVFIPRVSQ